MTFEDLISSAELAEAVGLSRGRVLQLANGLIELKLAGRVGKGVIFHKDAIDRIKNRRCSLSILPEVAQSVPSGPKPMCALESSPPTPDILRELKWGKSVPGYAPPPQPMPELVLTVKADGEYCYQYIEAKE